MDRHGLVVLGLRPRKGVLAPPLDVVGWESVCVRHYPLSMVSPIDRAISPNIEAISASAISLNSSIRPPVRITVDNASPIQPVTALLTPIPITP